MSDGWKTPEQTGNVVELGVLRVLEAIREYDEPAKFCQTSSGEMFGAMVANPDSERTPFYPRFPHRVAKLYGYWIPVSYRESYVMFNVSGILFNHGLERKGT